MLWDELPINFTEEAIARAADLAHEVESDRPMLVSLSDVLKTRGDALRASDVEVGLLLIADGLACDFMLTDGDYRDRWGPLGPMMEMGGGVYPPPVDTFPDALRTYFQKRAATTERPDLRARYFDLMWLRWKQVGDAHAAHGAYLDAAANPDFTDATDTMTKAEYLARAAELSLVLNIQRPETIAALSSAIRAGITNEGAGYVWQLVRHGRRLIAKEPDTARDLSAAIEAEAGRAPEGRRHRERSLLDAAGMLAQAISDAGNARRLTLARAASLETEAGERTAEGGLVEQALLQDAAALYEEAGSAADRQRLTPRLAIASVRSVEGLHVVESTTALPAADLDRAADELIEKLWRGDQLALGLPDSLGLWPSPERVEASLAEAMREFPLQYLVSRVKVFRDGRSIPQPASGPEQRQAQLTDHYARETAVRVAIASTIIARLRERGAWSTALLTLAVRSVEPSLADACRRGFESLEAGDGWSALHLLIPQLERAVRLVAVAAGADAIQRLPGGELRWRTLKPTLAIQETQDALGPRLAIALERLFVDQHGPNYRNETAHGTTDPGDDHLHAALLTALATLSVTVRLSIARQSASDFNTDSASGEGP